MNRVFPAERSSLREIREFIRGRAADDSFSGVAENLALAVSEACANAVLHSNSRQIQVSWQASPDRVEIVVQDDGIFRRAIPAPEFDGQGHRGIPLMMALLDQVSISGGTEARPGTLVRLVKFKGR